MLEKIIRFLEKVFCDKETLQLREELRQLGYLEEARYAEYHVVDLNNDSKQERYILVNGEKLYNYHSGLMEDTGVTKKERYAPGATDVFYIKDGKIIREEHYSTPISPIVW